MISSGHIHYSNSCRYSTQHPLYKLADTINLYLCTALTVDQPSWHLGVNVNLANFTENEIKKIVDGVDEHQKVLLSKFSERVTNTKKHASWKDIPSRVNAGSQCNRTVDDVKKKWEDVKSKTQKRATLVKKDKQKTGGGSLSVPSLTEIEEKVVGIAGDTWVPEIVGGIDTGDASTLPSTSSTSDTVSIYIHKRSLADKLAQLHCYQSTVRRCFFPLWQTVGYL